MTTQTENATNELATLDAQIAQAEEQLTAAERDLGKAARSGRTPGSLTEAVQSAQTHLDTLKGRRERAAILARIQEQEGRKAADARTAHGKAVKANGAALKRERAQLQESAQEAAQSVLEAVQAVREAVTRLRLHTALVQGAAGRIGELGLPLRDEYGNTFETGASVERGKAAVKVGEDVFSSLDPAQIQQVLRWISARVDVVEFHGRDSGSAYLKTVDGAIREGLTGRN